ncbi:pentapeptide repeat-containing protein, partial [Citreicella sp. C3M06]|uniref:pentapeptide repeat-containing protein n=1 Tax=Citreicella sp. C3M06 TaxID=2841564 RepID=UPI001C08EFB4|nr:pentapeptide repeat-containing protein [Citreicella sp. C3M06]
MTGTTTIPIGPGWLTLICLAVAAALIAAYLPSDRIKTPPALERFKDRLGYKGTDGGLFLFGLLASIAAAVLWLVIAGYLLLGIAGLVHELISSPVPPFDPVDDAQQRALWNWRFELAQMAALATLLSAVIALPITLNRLRLARQQTRLADETLFNQKITEAAADLHAQRQITIEPDSPEGSPFNGWEDDIVRRNAAIDRLEGLLRERSEIRPDKPTAERLARLLSVYVRELSREHKPQTHLWFEVREIQRAAPREAPLTEDEALERLGRAGEDASLQAMRRWAGGLRIRSDMENAVRVLGRLGGASQLRSTDLPIDLVNCNLQGARLAQLDLQEANLSWAEMQGANLSWAEMQGADLSGAKMQGANLSWAKMQGANLSGAKMQGANL